jgi:rhodanese-related sulfurtransferase
MQLLEIIGVVILAFIAGFFGAWAFNEYKLSNENMLIKEYYAMENAASVSPHSLRKAIDLGQDNFIIVDLRSEEEYNASHIVTAVNIPAYKDKDTSDYGAVQRIVSSFKELQEKNAGKEIVTYCYSIPCMTSKKIGKMLAENGIYVKHLNIGWNEWRYFWNLWNHEHEWNITKPEDYIEKAGENKSITKKNSSSCPINNDFGC